LGQLRAVSDARFRTAWQTTANDALRSLRIIVQPVVADQRDVGDFESEESARRVLQHRGGAGDGIDHHVCIEAALDRLKERTRIGQLGDDDDLLIGLIERIQEQVELLGVNRVVDGRATRVANSGDFSARTCVFTAAGSTRTLTLLGARVPSVVSVNGFDAFLAAKVSCDSEV
jgi:hypothetical protein